MQIVIELDEDVFTRLFDNGTEDYAIVNDDLFAIAKSIRNGTPLPKGHGRLKDVDELIENSFRIYDAARNIWLPDFVVNVDDIDSAPTILEADKRIHR